MFGIGIGILLVFTRSAGGASFAEALAVAGRFVFGWNALLIAAAVGSMLWFLSGKGRSGDGRPATALLSGLTALMGFAGLAYLRSVKMTLWYGGTALVLSGSMLRGYGPGAGADANAFAGLLAVTAIAGGQYLRNRHKQKIAEQSGFTADTHQFTGGMNAGMNSGISDDRPVRHVGGKRVETPTGGSGSSEPGPGGGDGAG